MKDRMLLVEGKEDKVFFEAYCKLLKIDEIEIFPPSGGEDVEKPKGNGWTNVIAYLPILLKGIKGDDDCKKRLGIVIDADYPPNNNGGFKERFRLVAEQLTKMGYRIPSESGKGRGTIFNPPDGFHPVGLWIMPDHENVGMLENFIQDLIVDPVQSDLLNHAKQSLEEGKLPKTLFNRDLHLAKATVFTWRAWQQEPGASLGQALNKKLLDRSKAVDFENWLRKVFP
jgi:hypothetical protein